jgi:hypothetical protein
MRLGDLLDLQRSDRRGRWLYIADPKSGEPYEVFLTPRAAKALDRDPDRDATTSRNSARRRTRATGRLGAAAA